MPYKMQHSCRIFEPSLLKKESFRTLKTKTKGLTIIVGRLKKTNESVTQAYRYDKKEWTSHRAENHCSSHDGKFEAAAKKGLTSSDIPALLTPGGNTAFQGKGKKELAYKLCLIENKERGMSDAESKKECFIFKEI